MYPDGEKNDQIGPAMAFGFPNPNPYGQERVLSFPYPPFSAIIRTNLRGIWGMLAKVTRVAKPISERLCHKGPAIAGLLNGRLRLQIF